MAKETKKLLFDIYGPEAGPQTIAPLGGSAGGNPLASGPFTSAGELLNPPRQRHAKILVVDGDAQSLHAIKSQLRASGYVVAIAADGETGLHAASLTIPDIILADINMPKLDGLAMLDRIREIDFLAEQPVIVISACTIEETRSQAARRNVDAFVTKPVEPRQLLKSISAALDRNEQRNFPCQKADAFP